MDMLSIIIPVYNSQNNLESLVKQIQEKIKIEYEIILINDESIDNSWEIIKKISFSEKNILGINLLKNVGQDNAIMAGLYHANGSYIIIMDDDLQHDPNYIMDLYKKSKENYDVVYGNFISKKQKIWKNFGSWLNGKFAYIFLKKPKEIYISPFKIIKKNIVMQILNYKSPFTYIDGIIFSLTTNISQIEIHHHSRKEGKSNYSISNSLPIFINHLTGYSIIPLRVVSFLGLILFFMSIILSIVAVINYFNNIEPEGWTSIMIALLLIGGLIMFSLGIIGEYLGRLYLLSSNKPQYVVKEKIKKQ
mgnify:CR=1 FL=1